MRQSPSSAAERCPLCGQPNACAMETRRTTERSPAPCWCTEVKFSAPVLARIPEHAKGRACLCRACASQTGAA